MQRAERFRFVAIVGLVVALISAGIGLAGDAFDEAEDEPTICEPLDDTVDDGDVVEGAEEGEAPVEGEDCPDRSEESHEPAGEGDGEGDAVEQDTTLEVSQERITECTEAAGVAAEDAPEEQPIPGETTGLENAIAHVLWNCLRTDNEGLVNALEHLSDNVERKELRDEAKAERRAEREAAKAERRAEREAAKAERKAEHDAAKAARALSRSS